jgi:hypothetical protein
VFDQQDTLTEKDFSSTAHAADERLPLPIDKLAPGEYLLTISAKSGAVSAQRDVRFTVVAEK